MPVDRFLGESIGPYRLVRRLGGGGMGTVYLGEHVNIGSKVAVKILNERLVRDAGSVRRFVDEARLANRIDHPGIVRILDCDHSEVGVYMIMEHLQGRTLMARCDAGLPLPTPHALRILQQVAAALAAAHAAGIIHRDIKPSNIFLVEDPAIPGGERVKILDFGVAKLLSAPSMTAAGQVLGTLAYMSPEQLRDSRNVDRRTDLYSLGVVAYLLLGGRLPHSDETVHRRWIAGERVPVARLPGQVPDALNELVLRALAHDREERFPSAEALLGALEAAARALEADRDATLPPYASARAISLPPRAEADTVTRAPDPRTVTLAPDERGALDAARRRRWTILGLAVGLVILGPVILVLLIRSPAEEAGSPVEPASPVQHPERRVPADGGAAPDVARDLRVPDGGPGARPSRKSARKKVALPRTPKRKAAPVKPAAPPQPAPAKKVGPPTPKKGPVSREGLEDLKPIQ